MKPEPCRLSTKSIEVPIRYIRLIWSHNIFTPFDSKAWSMSCGDLVALPWAVGLASLIAQTHLTYVVLVGALGFLTDRIIVTISVPAAV